MISIDTNVLIRVLVNDPDEITQVKAARNEVSNAQEIFISQIVQVETVWVLNRGYKLKKTEIIGLLNHLLKNLSYHLEKEDVYAKALTMYTTGKADFSDYLILADAQKRSVQVMTFDKHLSKSKGALLVKS